MKKIIVTLFIIFVSLTNAQETGVKFYDIPLQDAILKAKEENKIVMIEFWAPSCLPCINLSKQVFQNSKYGDYLNNHLISVKYSPADKEYNLLWKKYNLIVQSTVVFLNANGEEVERRCDYDGNSEKYFNFIKDVIDGKDLYLTLLKEFEKDSLNADLNYRMALKNIDRYEYTKANKYLENVIRIDTDDKYGHVEDSQYRLAYYEFNFGNSEKRMINYLRGGSSTDYLSKGYTMLISSYINKKEKEKCLALCEEALNKLKDDPEILNKYAWAIYSFKIKKEYKRGIGFSQKAVSINSTKANYLDTLAWLYLANGEQENAIESMKKAIEINPHPEYKKNLETMMTSKK